MKIFVLKIDARSGSINGMDYGAKYPFPYYGVYCSPQGHVIVAETEQHAREMAVGEDEPWWLYSHLTSCEEIKTDEEKIILSDTPTG